MARIFVANILGVLLAIMFAVTSSADPASNNEEEKAASVLSEAETKDMDTAFENFLKVLIEKHGIENDEVLQHIREQANLYYNLGLFQQSERVLKKYISVFKKQAGPKSISTRRLQVALAELLLNMKEDKKRLQKHLTKQKAKQEYEHAQKVKRLLAQRKIARELREKKNNSSLPGEQ